MTDEEAAEEVVMEPAPVEVPRAYGVVVTDSLGMQVLHPQRDELVETLVAMKADGYVSLLDLFGVDYLEYMSRAVAPGIVPERFEVVLTLINHDRAERTRVRVQVPANDPVVPTVFDVYPGAEALEREAYDMFGITFTDHPDMTRILMPDGWEGHPLRKDFAIGSVPVQFKAAPAK